MSGILLTCKSGALEGGKTRGVDKEFLALFSVLDENDSWLLDENIKTYCSDPPGVDKEDEGFMESNKMHAINGYFYGNLPDLEMCLGDTVNCSTSVTSSIPEASIQRIVDLGFSRDQAVLELQRTNGNVDAAATALVARSFANVRPPPRR